MGCFSLQKEHHSSWRKSIGEYTWCWKSHCLNTFIWMTGKLRTNATVTAICYVTACLSFKCDFFFQGSGSICSICVVLEWSLGKRTLLSFFSCSLTPWALKGTLVFMIVRGKVLVCWLNNPGTHSHVAILETLFWKHIKISHLVSLILHSLVPLQLYLQWICCLLSSPVWSFWVQSWLDSCIQESSPILFTAVWGIKRTWNGPFHFCISSSLFYVWMYTQSHSWWGCTWTSRFTNEAKPTKLRNDKSVFPKEISYSLKLWLSITWLFPGIVAVWYGVP